MSNLPDITFAIECSTPKEQLATVIQGIRNLADCRPVTSVVVYTLPGREQVFEELLPVCRATGKTLLPGIKASAVFPIAAETIDPETGEKQWWNKLDSFSGWDRLSDSAVLACHFAESPGVVIDIESAARGYVQGVKSCEIDLAVLVRTIQCLPPGIAIWVYPSLTYIPEDTEAPLSHGRQMNIVRSLLMGHSRTAFIDTSIGMPCDYDSPSVVENERRLRALYRDYCPNVELHLVRKLWLYGPGTKYWSDAEGIAALVGTVKSPDVAMIYTGYKRFAEGTETLARLLNLADGSREK